MISEEMLYKAAEEYNQAMVNALPDPEECVQDFSPKFEKKMGKLCRQQKYASSRRLLQRVACVLLVFLLGGSALLMLHPDVRAATLAWAEKQFGFYTVVEYFTTEGTPGKEPQDYTLQWMPEGYQYMGIMDGDGFVSKAYSNEDHQLIEFSYTRDTDTGYVVIYPKFTKSETFVDGRPADLYINNDPEYRTSEDNNSIAWFNEDHSVFFEISAPYGEDILIQMAESVVIAEEEKNFFP